MYIYIYDIYIYTYTFFSSYYISHFTYVRKRLIPLRIPLWSSFYELPYESWRTRWPMPSCRRTAIPEVRSIHKRVRTGVRNGS